MVQYYIRLFIYLHYKIVPSFLGLLKRFPTYFRYSPQQHSHQYSTLLRINHQPNATKRKNTLVTLLSIVARYRAVSVVRCSYQIYTCVARLYYRQKGSSFHILARVIDRSWSALEKQVTKVATVQLGGTATGAIGQVVRWAAATPCQRCKHYAAIIIVVIFVKRNQYPFGGRGPVRSIALASESTMRTGPKTLP